VTALAAVRPCVAADRTVQFGASLVYGKHDGLSHKIFYGDIAQLQPAERHCVHRALIGLAAGGVPAKPAVVGYGFRLAPGGRDRVTSKLE
jgi:hypothetical protein